VPKAIFLGESPTRKLKRVKPFRKVALLFSNFPSGEQTDADSCRISLNRYFWPTVITGILALALVCVFMVAPPLKLDRVITYIVCSPSGRRLAVGTRNGLIAICDLTKPGSCGITSVDRGILNDLQFSPDERFLAIANEDIQFLALEPSENSFLLRADRQNYGTVRFNKSGTELLTVTGRSKIDVINLETRSTAITICCSSIFGEVAFSLNGNLILNAGHWPRVWDEYGHLVRSLTSDRQEETFRPIAIDESMRVVFMGSQDGRVYAWDLKDYKLLMKSHPRDDYVDTIAVLDAIHTVAYCGFGKSLKLWNAQNGAESELQEIKPSSNLIALADGHSVVFGTNKGTVETWDLRGVPRLTSTIAAFASAKRISRP
jgi:WD40 repeat protein